MVVLLLFSLYERLMSSWRELKSIMIIGSKQTKFGEEDLKMLREERKNEHGYKVSSGEGDH